MTECYRCGQEGHARSECPQDTPLPPPPQPSGQAATTLPVPPRVYRDPAIAQGWAQTIRLRLGWDIPDEGDTT